MDLLLTYRADVVAADQRGMTALMHVWGSELFSKLRMFGTDTLGKKMKKANIKHKHLPNYRYKLKYLLNYIVTLQMITHVLGVVVGFFLSATGV